jgi:hypothetical protein
MFLLGEVIYYIFQGFAHTVQAYLSSNSLTMDPKFPRHYNLYSELTGQISVLLSVANWGLRFLYLNFLCALWCMVTNEREVLFSGNQIEQMNLIQWVPFPLALFSFLSFRPAMCYSVSAFIELLKFFVFSGWASNVWFTDLVVLYSVSLVIELPLLGFIKVV